MSKSFFSCSACSVVLIGICWYFTTFQQWLFAVPSVSETVSIWPSVGVTCQFISCDFTLQTHADLNMNNQHKLSGEELQLSVIYLLFFPLVKGRINSSEEGRGWGVNYKARKKRTCLWCSAATFRPKWREVCWLMLLRFICVGSGLWDWLLK